MTTCLSGIRNAFVDKVNSITTTPCCRNLGSALETLNKVIKFVLQLGVCIGFAIFNPIIFGFSILVGLAFPKFTMDLVEKIKAVFFRNILSVALGTVASIVFLPGTLLVGTTVSGAYAGAYLYERVSSRFTASAPVVVSSSAIDETNRLVASAAF